MGSWKVRGALAAAVVAGLASPALASAQVDTTCLLPVTRVDADTANIAFPDEAAIYWAGTYVATPGARLRIEGRYPRARYFSFNLYDAALRPFDSLSDVELAPDPGSTNPFLPGASRRATKRSYTAVVDAGPKRQNTMAAGSQPVGTFLYRVYLPDDGLDPTGGVGLPRVTLELPGGGREPVELTDCTQAAKPTSSALTGAIADASPPAALDRAPLPGYDPPRFAKFVNLTTSVFGFAGSPSTQQLSEALIASPLAPAGGSGAFLSNRDNAYVAAVVNRAYGQVLVLRGRAPLTPDTRRGLRRMPRISDLRYWSLCQNEFVTQRYIACTTDDRTPLSRRRTWTVVLSTPAQRPRNATLACGVRWLPWGPSPEGVLILRHMLPSPGYARSVQHATFRKEAATMGDVLPAGRYLADRAAFEARGCRGASR